MIEAKHSLCSQPNHTHTLHPFHHQIKLKKSKPVLEKLYFESLISPRSRCSVHLAVDISTQEQFSLWWLLDSIKKRRLHVDEKTFSWSLVVRHNDWWVPNNSFCSANWNWLQFSTLDEMSTLDKDEIYCNHRFLTLISMALIALV